MALFNNDNELPYKPPVPHYYGDTVRRLFLAGSIVMLVSIPFDEALLKINLSLGIFGILVLTFLAGYTSPKSRLVIISDTLIAAAIFLMYEYLAVNRFIAEQQLFDIAFLLRESVALLFLVAFYFSSKTLRGFSARRANLEE